MRNAVRLLIALSNGLPPLPAGYRFYVDYNGNYLRDYNGNYFMGLI